MAPSLFVLLQNFAVRLAFEVALKFLQVAVNRSPVDSQLLGDLIEIKPLIDKL
jgi:hypothetical protein